MHAFLLIGNRGEGLSDEVNKLTKRLKAKPIPYSINKIDDVRNLNSITNLSVSDPTVIVLEDIDSSTPEALNAFLKNLEEPQDNLYYILTASSIKKVLPTIVSRCQVMIIKNGEATPKNETEIKDFLSLDTSQRLSFFDKIRDRNEAIAFLEGLIFLLHKRRTLNNMELILETLTRLKANGNVNLQLSFLAINYR